MFHRVLTVPLPSESLKLEFNQENWGAIPVDNLLLKHYQHSVSFNSVEKIKRQKDIQYHHNKT